MERTKELTVFLENRPGTLARLTDALGERGIDILGFNLSNAIDHGALRLIVDDPVGAVHLLGEHNMFVLEHDVLSVRLKNQAGALTRLAEALASGDVNIEYAYGSAGRDSGQSTTLFLRVSDDEKAMKLLRGVAGVE